MNHNFRRAHSAPPSFGHQQPRQPTSPTQQPARNPSEPPNQYVPQIVLVHDPYSFNGPKPYTQRARTGQATRSSPSPTTNNDPRELPTSLAPPPRQNSMKYFPARSRSMPIEKTDKSAENSRSSSMPLEQTDKSAENLRPLEGPANPSIISADTSNRLQASASSSSKPDESGPPVALVHDPYSFNGLTPAPQSTAPSQTTQSPYSDTANNHPRTFSGNFAKSAEPNPVQQLAASYTPNEPKPAPTDTKPAVHRAKATTLATLETLETFLHTNSITKTSSAPPALPITQRFHQAQSSTAHAYPSQFSGNSTNPPEQKPIPQFFAGSSPTSTKPLPSQAFPKAPSSTKNNYPKSERHPQVNQQDALPQQPTQNTHTQDAKSVSLVSLGLSAQADRQTIQQAPIPAQPKSGPHTSTTQTLPNQSASTSGQHRDDPLAFYHPLPQVFTTQPTLLPSAEPLAISQQSTIQQAPISSPEISTEPIDELSRSIADSILKSIEKHLRQKVIFMIYKSIDYGKPDTSFEEVRKNLYDSNFSESNFIADFKQLEDLLNKILSEKSTNEEQDHIEHLKSQLDIHDKHIKYKLKELDYLQVLLKEALPNSEISTQEITKTFLDIFDLLQKIDSPSRYLPENPLYTHNIYDACTKFLHFLRRHIRQHSGIKKDIFTAFRNKTSKYK